MATFPGGLYIKRDEQDTAILTFGKSPEIASEDTANGVARFGGMMRQPNYCNAYYKSAKILLETAKANAELDEFGLPIFYLVRHSLELKLKGLVGLAYEIYSMQSDLVADYYPADSSPSNRKKKALEESHDIELLYENLKIICNTLNVNVPESLFESVISIVANHETHPTWSRYHRGRAGGHVDDEVVLPIVQLVENVDALYLGLSYEQPDTLESELHSSFSSLLNTIESQ